MTPLPLCPKRIALKPLLATTVVLLMSSCSVYKTVDTLSTGDKVQGTPYFLPKGLIHLVISDAAGSSSKPDATAAAGPTATATVSATATATTTPPASNATKSGSTTTTRTVKVEAVIVPDKDKGPYSAHYIPNALHDDIADIGVSDNQLLQSGTATTTDETAAVVSNLVQTGINIAKTLAQTGIQSFSDSVVRGGTTITIPQLPPIDIDVTFDPEGDGKVLNGVNAILANYGMKVTVDSPSTPKACPRNVPSTARGLWFRQLKAYEVVVTQKATDTDAALLAFEQVEQQLAPADPDAIKSSREAAVAAIKKLEADSSFPAGSKELAGTEAIVVLLNSDSPKAAVTKLAELRAGIPLASLGPLAGIDFDQAKIAVDTLVNSLGTIPNKKTIDKIIAARKASLRNISGEVQKRNSFAVVLPDKESPFCFTISRGAFIKKTTALTIVNGILRGMHIDKPSEILGFSKIPLDISERIAELPKGLIGVKVDYLTQKNNLLTQQTDLYNAQASMLKAQQALKAAQDAAAQPPTPTK